MESKTIRQAAARERRVHRGRDFEVWTGERGWFWLFPDGGAIGAASSESHAESEARRAIDQFAAQSVWGPVLDSLADYLTTA